MTACGPEKRAIDLESKDEFVKVKVGTVILEPVYDIFPIENKEEWGYKRYENVISSLEFERLICSWPNRWPPCPPERRSDPHAGRLCALCRIP